MQEIGFVKHEPAFKLEEKVELAMEGSKDKDILTVDGSPPEKKVRSNQENASRANSPQPTSSTKSKSSGKGKMPLENILARNSGNISKDQFRDINYTE